MSTTDCLAAVFWVAVMRCRWLSGRRAALRGAAAGEDALRPDEVARFNIAVDLRKKLAPPISDVYIGDAFVVATAEATIEGLLRQSPPE